MLIIRNKQDLKEAILEQKKANKTIGYVPTMGFLHEGHMTLVSHARKETDFVVMSVLLIQPSSVRTKTLMLILEMKRTMQSSQKKAAWIFYLYLQSKKSIQPN